jgi:YD repeat-containing protein
MRISRSESRPLISLTSLLLTYSFFISLCTPFIINKVEATSPPRTTSVSTAPTLQSNGESAKGLLVRFLPDASEQEITSLVESKGLRRVRRLRGSSGLELLDLVINQNAETVATDLSLNPVVAFVEPNYLIAGDSLGSRDQLLGTQLAFNNTNHGQLNPVLGTALPVSAQTSLTQPVIAIIDSGIDWAHPDLTGKRWVNSSEQANSQDDDQDGFVDDAHGWDFVAESNLERDEQGHGTSVAGLIVAAGNNSTGIPAGMWQPALMSLRVLDGTGTGDIARAVEAIDYAVAHGAQVINLSWGTNGASQTLRAAIERAATRGVIIVCSAGNAGRDIESAPRYPASFDLPNLIAVASTDNADQLASWSDWGGAHVAVAAPGVDMQAPKAGGGYLSASGTSFSAAQVSGLAGIIRTLRPQLSAERTKELILGSARQIPALQGKVSSGGVINSAGTVALVDTLPPGEGLGEATTADSASNNNTQNSATGPGPSSAWDNGQGERFKVTPPVPTRGAPGPNLPNLNEMRHPRATTPPRAKPSIPSTRCSPHARGCGQNQPSPVPLPVPTAQPVQISALQESSPVALLASNESIPAVEALLGMESSGAAISDSPFAIKLPSQHADNQNSTAQLNPAPTGSASFNTGFLALMPQSSGVDTIWVEDSVPTGGVEGSNNETWYWVSSNPAPFYGTLAHRSEKANSAVPLHNHYFTSATATLSVNASDKLFTYVYIDPGVTAPAELMLQWSDGTTWYNAYWGTDNITGGSGQRTRIGDIPVTGAWVKLEVAVSAIGIGNNTTLRGMAFNAWDGRVFWDQSGKTTPASPPPPPTTDQVWVEDSIPAGGVPGVNNENNSPNWSWINSNPVPHTGALAHLSVNSTNTSGLHNHYFTSATSTLTVNTGDTLFCYVYIDSSVAAPAELMLQWSDGVTWYNAYWGANLIAASGTSYHIGNIPAAGTWVRLEVPASQLGLEGKTLSGMSFTLHSGRVTWDRAGKATPQAAPTLESVVWTRMVGVTASGNNLTKTAVYGWGNAGANSAKAIASGDGYMEFTSTGQTTESRIAGLSRGDTDQSYQDVDFGIDLAGNGQIYIYEAGVSRGTFGSYGAGDVFRVAIEGGVVKYRKNGVLLYTSTVAPSYPLLVDCALANLNGTLNEVKISGSLQASDPYTPPPAVDFSNARIDPENRTGMGGDDMISGNYSWGLPLVGLKGRAGLDLGLSLSYNSLVWTKSGSYITYDADRGFPSPGFRLGFPTIQQLFYNPQTGKNAYLLITPSGSRVELRQTGNSNIYESADSSYLRLTDSGNGQMLLQTTDGTRLSYVFVSGEYRCTEIKDRNGNFLTVNYDGYGHITTIIDTLARTVTFNYDANHNPISITQLWNGQVHEWATFGYSNLTLQTNFGGLSIIGIQNGTTIPVLSQVSLPDGSAYRFSYSTWGQVYRIAHYAKDNHLRRQVTYNLPQDANLVQSDCPRFTERRDWAENWNGDEEGIVSASEEAVTTYSIFDFAGGWRQAIMPDGTVYKESFATSGWQKGLATNVETYANNALVRTSETVWTQDKKPDGSDFPYQLNPRLTETKVSDPSGNIRKTTISYDHLSYADFGLPYKVTEYGGDNANTIIRETYTDYNLATNYLSQRIIGLVSERHIKDGQNYLSKTTYAYDAGGTQLAATKAADGTVVNATQHDPAYNTSWLARGNLTSVSRYNVEGSNVNNVSLALTSQVGYDTDGSVIFSCDALGHQTSISYLDSFSDGLNRNTFAYPTSVTDGDNNISSAKYSYDLGVVTRTLDPKGAEQTMEYDSAGRIQFVRTPLNGAWKFWAYPDRGDAVQNQTTLQDGAPAYYSIMVFDGADRGRGVAGDLPNSAGLFSGSFTYYDVMGRVWKQSTVAEINSLWVPAGDDAVIGFRWRVQTYDWKGRPRLSTNPDGTTKEATYGGCGCAGGETVELRDEMNRRQKVTSDVLGRAVKAEVFDANGASYATTVNTYNALDQTTKVRQYQGNDLSSIYQDTVMEYDGYGRLWKRKLPQQTGSTVYSYYADDQVATITDARGATAAYYYNNNRHLLTTILYRQPGAADIDVSFTYDNAGNRIGMIDSQGRSTYHYDTLSRMDEETRTFKKEDGTETIPFKLTYAYNLAGQLTSIKDHFQATVSYARDSEGRITAVNGSGYNEVLDTPGGQEVTQYASNFTYRAWGALKHLSYSQGLELNLAYNEWQQLDQYEVKPLTPGNVNDVKIHNKYDYYDDGRVSFISDMIDHKFDRSYEYDFVDRLAKANTSHVARGEQFGVLGPYQQTYQYDAFGHMTSRTTKHWSKNFSYSTTYLNNRDYHAGYDAAGNQITAIDGKHFDYDVAGDKVKVWDSTGNAVAQGYDGDHRQVKRVETVPDVALPTVSYSVRSTVLGGAVLTELYSDGTKRKTNVYADGQLIATQNIGEELNGYGLVTKSVMIHHKEPVTGNERDSWKQFGVVGEPTQLDPLGVDAWSRNKYEDEIELDRDWPKRMHGSIEDPWGGCMENGLPMPCSMLGEMLQGPFASRFRYNEPPVSEVHAPGRSSRRGRFIPRALLGTRYLDEERYRLTFVENDRTLHHAPLQRRQDTAMDIARRKNCATPNSIVETFKAKFESLWDETVKSGIRAQKEGDENGMAIFYESSNNTYPEVQFSQGYHFEAKSGYYNSGPQMPEARSELRRALMDFHVARRAVALFAIFHTHPDYLGGDNRNATPTEDDTGWLRDFGNPLGIIRNGKGYGFFIKGENFGPDDPRANECIWDLMHPK